MCAMIKDLAQKAKPLLDVPYVRRTRRNHALEHATIHVLSQRLKSLSAAGRSDASGFWLMGNVDTAAVESAAAEALRRMRNGEASLAIHPNCGTSLLTTATFVSMAGWLGSLGVKRGMAQYASRLPTVLLLSMVGLVISRPVGLQLQEHFTTLGQPGDLIIQKITRVERPGLFGGTIILHRVETAQG
jgi:Domain of unknown function (DUF6391)